MTRKKTDSVTLRSKPRRRFGIAARLTLAFAGLAGLAAVAGVSSSWFSMQSAEIVTGLGSKVLPTVTASLAFAQQSSVLASEAPQLASQTDPAALAEHASRLEALLADQTKRLSDLRGMVATPAMLDPLQKLSADLGPKIAQLKATAADRIAVRTQIQKTVAQALSDYQDLMDFVRPLQEATQTGVDGEMGSLKKAGSSTDDAAAVDKDMTTLRTVMDIQASGNLAFGMLSAAANAADESASDIRSQYNWAEVYIGKAVKAFGSSGDGERMKKLVDALLSSGSGNDSVFVLRAREVDLNGKIAASLIDMVKMSATLSTEVKGLVQTQEGAARTAVDQSGTVTRQNLLVNAVTSSLVIVAALLIGGFYVRRSITNRLNGLAGVMKRLAGGDRAVTIATGGRDEITEMAAAVEVFKTNMIRGDELAAETARMAQDREAARQQTDAERTEAAARQAAVVNGLATGLARLAQGDLTYDLDRPFSDEYEGLRRDFNEAVLQLRSAMEQIVSNADSLRSGTDEISTAADDLSRRTESQAASLEETAAALDEVTGNVRKTAEGATHARDVVGTTKKEAQESGEIMKQAVEAMKAIEASSGQIGQIIGVVDEIAFQTNLLALNAGVEAARAGDAGRGFAVVASEVRALAQRSADAAKEIKALVSTSKTHVARGADLVGRSGAALQSILTQVGEINVIVSEIATSAKDQTHGLEQVNTAVNQMDQVTQQNAAMVEETTAASHNLARDTEALATLIGRFKVEAGRARSNTPQAPVAPRSKPRNLAAGRRAQTSALRKADTEPAPDDSWTEF